MHNSSGLMQRERMKRFRRKKISLSNGSQSIVACQADVEEEEQTGNKYIRHSMNRNRKANNKR